MPTENESSAESGAAPQSTTTISACWVPTPPGVSGRSVESDPTTRTSSAFRRSAWMPNASQNVEHRADAAEPAERLREDDRMAKRRGGAGS